MPTVRGLSVSRSLIDRVGASLRAIGATLAMVAAPLGAALATPAVNATQHLVRPGDDWSKLKDRLNPGDEVILMPGKHRPATFDGLAGTKEKPISIKTADPRTLVTIEAPDVGLILNAPQYVNVENLVIIGGRRAGIIVKGESAEKPSVGITLRNIYAAKSGDLAERAGIRLENVKDGLVRNARVEGWHRAGIHVVGSKDVRIEQSQFVAFAGMPNLYAIAIDSGSERVTVESTRFASGIGVAVAIGVAETETPPPLPNGNGGKDAGKSGETDPRFLADAITIERCLGKRLGRFVQFGSCRGALVRANTVEEIEAAYEITAPPEGYAPVTDSTFLANLFAWTPGALKRFSVAADGVETKGLAVETNLWWSVELPGARKLLGDFVGDVKNPQVLDLDPKLDNYARPRAEKAKSFGFEAP